MTSTIITKNSSTASAVPAGGDLVAGELAINTTDKKVYTKNSSSSVVQVVGTLGNQDANSVSITGGAINGTTIGASTATTVRGTTVTATTGFVGSLTGNVTGNITGNTAGTHTGAVIGDVAGNVTASTGTSSFNSVDINGTLNMNSGTVGTITGLSAPTASTDAATKGYVDTSISNLIGTAPAALDTLGEISDALNDDANLAGTLTTSIATKLTKAGDTMSGNLSMGSNKITDLAAPTVGADATNKTYVDAILGSATSAATSATAAASSATSATASATSASASATSAAASYDSFDDRYLGSKSSAPSVDNDGNTLLTGALYWDSVGSVMKVWTGTAWVTFNPVNNPVDQTDVGTAANEIPLNQYLGKMAYKDVVGMAATLNPAPTIASAATIQPLTPIVFVSGTTTINTITVPAEFVGGGQITIIPTGLLMTGTSGNIALATVGAVSKALIMTYDATTTKWYPSY